MHLDIYHRYKSQLGSKLLLRVGVFAEYPGGLSFEEDRKDNHEILALLKPQGVDPAIVAKVLDRASTVHIDCLRAMIDEAFDLIPTIIPLTKTGQNRLAAVTPSRSKEVLSDRTAATRCTLAICRTPVVDELEHPLLSLSCTNA